MKWKQLERVPARQPKTDAYVATAEELGDTLILDVWENRERKFRYCIDVKTGQHGYLEETWSRGKLLTALGANPNYYWPKDVRYPAIDRKEKQHCLEKLGCATKDVYQAIDWEEDGYDRGKRRDAEKSRQDRLDAYMEQAPEAPENLREWIFEKEAGEDYLMKTRKKDEYTCTNCGEKFAKKELPESRHNQYINCPECKKYLQIKTRTERIRKNTQCYLIQPIGEDMVIRVIYAHIEWECRKHTVTLNEAIRVVGYNLFRKRRSTKKYRIYYRGWESWITGNHGNYRSQRGYLYPGDFKEILKNTIYQKAWTTLEQTSQKGLCMNYSRLLAGVMQSGNYAGVTEYLAKGRFWKLLQEVADDTEYPGWNVVYRGDLNLHAETIEGIFGICNKQMINRIRDENGGHRMVSWMRYSEKTKKKIPTEALRFLERNKIDPEDIALSGKYMSPQQIVNYIIRQQKEQYPAYTANAVLEQYEDYLSMCQATGKDLTDEMVYRPRELKRRHDEVIVDQQQMQILREMSRDSEQREAYAREMREKYPTAEQTMQEIRERYEYENGEYKIIVPQTLMDIVLEGRALHHCVGSSERYFDRIEDRETYICFLRRQSAPGVPFYTIEVEPGGTIRQHRSYLDEEPGIEEIRGFLREWQKVLKSRLTWKDRELARTSKIKREQNIEELKAKRNTRVLKGLEEDFLEAEAAGWN